MIALVGVEASNSSSFLDILHDRTTSNCSLNLKHSSTSTMQYLLVTGLDVDTVIALLGVALQVVYMYKLAAEMCKLGVNS